MIFNPKDLLSSWSGWPNISSNLHFILTLLVAVTLPVDVNYQYCSLAIVLLFLNWLAQGRFREKGLNLVRHKIVLLPVLFYLLHVTGLFYTSDLADGLFDLEKKLSVLIVPLVLFSSTLSVRQRDFILFSFIVFCLILAVIGISYGTFHYHEVISTRGPEHLVTYISNIHRVYFSFYLLLCYFLLICFYRKYNLGKNIAWKAFTAFLLALSAFFIIVMASRIVLILLVLTTGLILFYFMVVKKKEYVKAGILASAGILIMVIVYICVPHVNRFMNDLTQNFHPKQEGHQQLNSVNLRVLKYESCIQVIRDNWLLGVGTGDVQHELDRYYSINSFEEGYTHHLDAHNQYFQTWIGLGLPGLLSFLALLVLGLVKGFKDRNYPFIYFLLLFSLCCLTESILTTQKGIIFLALFYPLLYFNSSNLSFNPPVIK